MSSAIQKCTTTQCKNAPPYNAYLTEISNNPRAFKIPCQLQSVT